MPFDGGEFVLANTHAPHQLVDGKYMELRRLCFESVDTFKATTGNSSITHLRDVTVADFEQHAEKLDEDHRRRSKHIIHENSRVLSTIQKSFFPSCPESLQHLGAAISASHVSSRDDFGNSCEELDDMVNAAEGIDGFLGARLMGGGFGGCTINLVKAGYSETFAAELATRYKQKKGIEPAMLVCSSGNGAYNGSVQGSVL